MASREDVVISCEDFGQFQEALKDMRAIDDKIIYALNTSIPTTSFKGQVNATEKCKQLHSQMCSAYDQRDSAIKKCISYTSQSVDSLKQERKKNPDDVDLLKTLRKEQNKLRLMQSELNIEEVVRNRSLKVFHERCRNHYVPPSGKYS